MPLFDPQTFSPEQAALLKNVPGQSLSETNTPEQIALAQGSLKGTLPSSNPQTPSLTGGLPQPNFQFGATGSQFGFANFMQTAIDRLNTINPMMQQRQLLLKHIYDQPLSAQEIQKLPPELQQTVQTGDKQELEMATRLLNDQISGRTGTLDQSIKFLSDTYNANIQQAEKQRKEAQDTVKLFVQQYGSQAGKALTSIYGPDKVKQLEQVGGLDLSGISHLPSTIAERRVPGVGAVGSTSGAVDSMAQALLDGRLAPSQLPGFGQNSLKAQALRRAFEIDPTFDSAKAEQQYSFGKANKTQLIQFSINSVTAAQGIIKSLSNKVKRTDIQPINALELQFSSKTGNVDTAKFLGAIKILGDEYGTVFGQGAATDFKAQLGLAVLDPTLSQEQFNGLIDTTIDLMKARSDALYKQAGRTSPFDTESMGTNLSDEDAYQLYLQGK